MSKQIKVPATNRKLLSFRNNLAWLDVMYRESNIEEGHGKPSNFRGLVLTGWSRYDHFAVLAELLPASVPSLTTNLISVSHGYFNASWQKELYSALECADNSRQDIAIASSIFWIFFQISPFFFAFCYFFTYDFVSK